MKGTLLALAVAVGFASVAGAADAPSASRPVAGAPAGRSILVLLAGLRAIRSALVLCRTRPFAEALGNLSPPIPRGLSRLRRPLEKSPVTLAPRAARIRTDGGQ